MLRTRILAAATAAVLMLGMSVGGAGAALAAPPAGVGGGPADSPCNQEPGFTDDGVNGEKYNIGIEVDVDGTMSFAWGTLTWTEYQLVFTANPGWTVDLCVKGGSQESNSIELDSGSVTIDRVQSISHFMWANPSFTAPVATAAVTTNPRNCFVGTSFTIDTGASSNVTWGEPVITGSTISITATATGGALFAAGLAGVSSDRTQRTFSTTYEEAGGDDCVLPSIDVTAQMTPLNCEPGTGSFTAGLFDPSDPNADKLLWTTTEGAVPSASANTVNGPTTVTVTVRVADAYLGDFALNDSSGLGTVSIITVGDTETALITWTFAFTAAEDCPSLAGSSASSQCEADAPYLEWSIDLSDAGGAVSLPTDATLTLRSATNPALTYVFPAVTLTSAGVTTGSALWPGAAVDGDGNGTAWPGWAFVGGEWVEDASNYGWVRGADVELLIEVNPSVVIPVSYPNATPDCANPPVVVPDVSNVDVCEGTGKDAVQIATFTVTRAANASYEYTVNGGDPIDVVFPDGEDTVTVSVSPLDVVVVTASPADGFRLSDDYEPWTHTFIGAAFCLDTFPTTTASAEIVAPDCLGNAGTIALTNGLGVIWTLNGEVVAGNTTHTIPTGTAVDLRASLEGPSDEYPGGFGWNDPEQQTEWSAVMEVDPESGGEECLLDEDELPTLAFTGANGLTTGLGLFAVIAMIVGMGFVIRRHQITA